MLKGTQTQNETTSPKRTNFPIATPQSTNMVTLRKTFFLRRYTSSDGWFCHCHVCVGGCIAFNIFEPSCRLLEETSIDKHRVTLYPGLGKNVEALKKNGG